jgi:Zn-finger nucleic acid-binding protein
MPERATEDKAMIGAGRCGKAAGIPDRGAGKPDSGKRPKTLHWAGSMLDPVICLSCGGLLESRPNASPGGRVCKCIPRLKEAKSVLCPSCGGSIKVGTRACPYCSTTVATCRCAACLAWNLAGAAHCQACGRPLVAADHGSGQAAGCNCPRCGARLQAREYAELSVDECDRCGGLFLAPAMLERLVAAHDASTGLRLALPKRAVERESVVQYIHCPVCGKLMNREAFGRISGIVLDVCKSHGLWFDAGELSEAIRFVEQGGLARARERELEDLVERERRSRADLAMAQASADLSDDESGWSIRVTTGKGVFAELLHSIIKAWR